MEEARSLLSDTLEAPKPHFPLRLEESPVPQLFPDRVKSPLTLAMDGTTSHLNSVAETFKSHFPHCPDGSKSLLLQGLEGTMALLAARGVEGTKAMYPLGMDNLRPFLPYGGEGVNYLQERLDKCHKSSRDRKDSSRAGAATPEGGDTKRVGERPREHKSHKKTPSPKSQLSNPRHDAHLVHAIRELHEEEFGLDAVLLAEGGHVGAHCAVLAAASPFLKSLLLHANDHPAIISVTGTSLSTLQALVACLYTGNIPAGASVYHLAEAAKLLKMDELSAVLQKTCIAQGGGSLLELSRPQSASRSTIYGSQGLALPLEPRFERSGKRIRSNRLDQILYQKLNVNHLAPADIPDPCLVPPPESSRVPLLESLRVPPPDPRGGILGELLTKADPLRTVFSSGYSIADLGFDSSYSHLKPLNLSKPSKSHSSSTPDMSSHTSSYTSSTNSSTSTTSSCNIPASSLASNLASSLASQTDLNLSGHTSLAPTMPGGMTGLLSPLTPSNLMSPSTLATFTSSSALASLGAQHSLASTTPSKSKSSSNGGSSRSRSSNKFGSSGRSGNGSRHSSNSNNRNSSQHSLPLLYTLKSGMMTPEVAKEVYEQLKLNPQLASLPGFDSLHNLSSLSSSASLQSLANLHNLSSLQSFPTLFPFLAPTSPESPLLGNTGVKDLHMSPGAPSSDPSLTTTVSCIEAANDGNPSIVTCEDQVALNLSSNALTTQSESPKPTIQEESSGSALTPNNSVKFTSSESGIVVEETDEVTQMVQPPSASEMSTNFPPLISQNSPESAIDISQNENICNNLPNGSTASSMSHASSNTIISNSMDSSSLPLLLMGSGASLAGMAQQQADLAAVADLSLDSHCAALQDHSMVSPDITDSAEDNGIEVIEEIPGVNRSQLHARKTLYHAGHMGRKRKGCGECEGCQVVEDCGQCRFCRDKAKFGGPNRLKQVCVYKRCVLAELEPEDSKKRRKTSGKKGRGKCGGCDGCQRTSDCNECYACLHNAAAQPPARRKVCEMRVCEQQQMEEVRAALSVAGEPSPYSTDSLMAESMGISSGASSPTPDGQPSTHNDKMKLMRKMLKKKFAQPYSRVSPSKVRTKYYCGECPGCQTTTPCGNCLYCEDMPKFGGPGRYRQKCVKQLCVYHPRLQALKLSNRSKLTYDEQHISHETLSHLGAAISCASEETIDLGCADSRENLEELESLEGAEHIDETDEITEGEDSNATIHLCRAAHVENSIEEVEPVKIEAQIFKVDMAPLLTVDVTPETVSVLPPATDVVSTTTASTCTAITTATSAIPTSTATPAPPHTPEPEPEPKPQPDPEPQPEPKHEPQPELEPEHTLIPTLDPVLTHVPTPTASPTPPPPSPTPPAPSPTPPTLPPPLSPDIADTQNADDTNDIEGEEDLDDEVDDDEDEEAMSDASDVPSPPSTPSPRPRLRGRGRYRGRGRGRGKNGKIGGVSTKRTKKVLRRGRRRRTPRFNLDPDDNSDYDEQYLLTELEGETPSEEHLAEDGDSADVVHQDSLVKMTKDSVDYKDDSKMLQVDKANTASDENQGYSNTPKTDKLIRISQNIEPDVFEFQDSQETVIDNKSETTNSVMMKHNGPYVFQDEELRQGGRDVNENVGTVGETASA